MLCEAVKKYLIRGIGLPFFYAVGDEKYEQILRELKGHNVIVDRISAFCHREDKFPDIDEVISHLRTLDTDYHTNKHVLIGLGEFLALRGATYADRILRRFDKVTLGNAKVILLLRCITQSVRALQSDDSRLVEQKRLFIEENTDSTISITCMSFSSQKNVAKGVKGLLFNLEDGCTGNIQIVSALEFSNSLISVKYINNKFEVIKNVIKNIYISETMGTESQWEQLYNELINNKNSLDDIFLVYNCSYNYEDNIYEKCAGFEFKNWLFFIFLKQNYNHIKNDYLAYVVANTEKYEDMRTNLLTGIINIKRNNPKFNKLYDERKKLIKNFPESEIVSFLLENQINPTESIYRYTDNTKKEREAIISWVSKYGYGPEIQTIIETIYPDLAQYMGDYVFSCEPLSYELTEYFKQYRQMKITNQISDDFLQLVEDNARRLPYTRLKSRDSVIKSIQNKKDAFLFWIDALGVEYLPYITFLAKKKGLSIHTDITYVELPTVTSINKRFFDDWPFPKEKESRLDEIKHKDAGGFSYEVGQAPVHLASELEVIKEAMEKAATELALHKCKTFVIASDHGASRLAVIHRQEEKYETDTKGEHSGRCCKEFPNADLTHAIKENGYLVLADYGRFKNSRAANVEVHGGATLEEVVVPVITLSLREQSDLIVKIIDSDSIYCDRHKGTTLQLYISYVSNHHNVSVVINNKSYKAKIIDNTHYNFDLNDIRRAKKNVLADVYDGDDFIDTVQFVIKGKQAEINADFDDLN